MGLCNDSCCNAEARRIEQAREDAAFAARQEEFEAFLAKGERLIPGELTPSEMTRLNQWADQHAVAG